MSDRLLLVDGHSIANRAFFGVPLLTNSKGQYTNALYGFFNILFSTIDRVHPDKIAIAFDLPEPTFRHKMFEEYKGNRSPMQEELREQIPELQEMLRKAGVQLLMKGAYEADDLLGTASKRAAQRGEEVTILSGDRDLLQLVDDHITMLLPKTKKDGTEYEVYHPQEVEEKYGVAPLGYLQMKALMGDSSDNIPGVPKIGEKTASKIVQTYGTVEEAIAHASEVKPPMAGKNLAEYAEQARMSLVLATIITDAPEVEEPGKVTEWTFHTPEFVEELKKYELKSLLKKVMTSQPKAMLPDESTIEETVSVATAKSAGRKVDSMTEMAAEVRKEMETLPGKPLVCAWVLDGDEEMMVSAAVNGIYAEGSTSEFLNEMASLLEDDSIAKVFCDAKPLYKAAFRRNLKIRGTMMDEMIAAYLLNATTGHYTMDTIASTYLDRLIPSEDEVLGTGVKRISWTMVEDQEREKYVLSMVSAMEDAYPILVKELKDNGMQDLYDSIEGPLVEVLASMENEGIRIDLDELERIGSFLRKEISRLQNEIYAEAGYEFNINSTKQLGKLLFEEMNLPAGKKTKSGYSTSAEVLEGLRMYDIVNHILLYRQLSKLESTYVEGLKPCVEEDGCIHCNFQQAVTATGRLSCTEPNLQNIPIRESLGRELRKAFVPKDENRFFLDADYSQIELRLVAHMSGDEDMIRAYQTGADIHRLTASEVLHIPYEDVTSSQRSSAKAINFGIIYGMGAFSLANDLGISNKEASRYIEEYFARFPKVKGFLDHCVEMAKESGSGVTLFGRRRKIEELKAKNFAQRSFGERVAKNMPIQGSAADIIKIAMVKVYDRLQKEGLKSRLILQVHDELMIETYRDEEEMVRRILVEEMQGAADLLVPLTVEVTSGENWYEAK